MKATEVVFSRAEARLMDERGTKNAASAAFNSNLVTWERVASLDSTPNSLSFAGTEKQKW
jgi:hypothetical protein